MRIVQRIALSAHTYRRLGVKASDLAAAVNETKAITATDVVQCAKKAALAGERPAPDVGLAGERPAPDVGLAGERPAPDVDLAGDSPMPDVGLAAEHPAPDVGLAGEHPAPDVGLAGERPAPDVGLAGERPAPDVGLAGERPSPDVGLAGMAGFSFNGTCTAYKFGSKLCSCSPGEEVVYVTNASAFFGPPSAVPLSAAPYINTTVENIPFKQYRILKFVADDAEVEVFSSAGGKLSRIIFQIHIREME
ncbi:hypothetical protein HAZT_HAZT011704 [Hyalella azteca]|uniref:Uncharacterized protein n=1 Tax=Hyalella azteca TaxID=294128 RepID=A0A6A0GQQ0_HYAAZ|nr:hypothetical protein HAZT_HAZT011704 [Hyalella azteca]